MVDSASGELKTCSGNSVESFCVRRKTPPFGSSTSSPKMMRSASFVRPARKVWLTTSPIRYLPGGQHFVVELGQRAGHLQVSSLGDGILGPFGLAEFLANPLLDLLLELRISLRRQVARPRSTDPSSFSSGSPSARFSISSALR